MPKPNEFKPNEPVLNIVVRWAVTLCFGAIGGTLTVLLVRLLSQYTDTPLPSLSRMAGMVVLVVLAMSAVGWIFSPRLVRRLRAWMNAMERFLEAMPIAQAIAVTAGFAFGLFIALLVSLPLLFFIPGPISVGMSVILYAVLSTLGGRFASKRWRDMPWADRFGHQQGATAAPQLPDKLLDTSVIIDGRIFDICKAGFMEGTLVIPEFVLAELRHIADSQDALRRNRGRRGLDVLARIQKELDMPVRIDETDYSDLEEVDVKLLRLARETQSMVVTNDFNLNKVASVTGVRVLNINELANAVKPVLLPGEEMEVKIVKEGKEIGQGVGFLEDGTMIVVENARRLVGSTIEIVVTTALQTAAGRMIFGKPKMPVGQEPRIHAGMDIVK